jgi:Recombination endonuclease VII
MKRCRLCGELKPLDDFYRSPGMADGYRHDCKVCNLAAKAARTAANPQANRDRVKRWQEENPERLKAYRREYRQRPERKSAEREHHLLRKYGINVALAGQGGVCRIRGRPRPENRTLHVDHDHTTGTIRGLLCFRCSNALGDFEEQYALFQKTADYLDRDDELEGLVRERVKALSG